MGVLDRLDSIDRRFGVGQGKRRPPNRLEQWNAKHPWMAGLLYGVVLLVPTIVLEVASDASGRGFAAVTISLVVYLLLGFLLACMVRNAVVKWDQEHELPAGSGVTAEAPPARNRRPSDEDLAKGGIRAVLHRSATRQPDRDLAFSSQSS